MDSTKLCIATFSSPFSCFSRLSLPSNRLKSSLSEFVNNKIEQKDKLQQKGSQNN